MRLLSVNVGRPVEVSYRGRTYPTAIFKSPVAGRVRVSRLNVAGDAQGNPRTHGGPDMAVHAYPHEHYAHWAADMATGPLPFGAFGENLTTEGLTEETVSIGDVLAIGTARLQVTEPRTPCHKLAMKFRDDDLPRRFAESGRVGFYLRVLEEGEIGAGDTVALAGRDPAGLTVAETLRLWADRAAPAAALERALAVTALSAGWRERFGKRRAAAGGARPARPDPRPWDAKRLTWA